MISSGPGRKRRKHQLPACKTASAFVTSRFDPCSVSVTRVQSAHDR
ncbi:BnaA02g04060D [Brassica napus]|uniref:(rape) hypothetical protein n=1 Tax=Brassica napus TaxID=3708 RepID=A0A078IWB4_BRANA|nr:unnamed protein product [Brassica napus]CDY53248.1 BnaA02g04060D [Brassica napus]